MRFVAFGSFVFAVLGGCGDAGPCGRLGALCESGTVWRETLLRVDGAVEVDLDGDGTKEVVGVGRDSRQIGVSWRGEDPLVDAVFVTGSPVAVAAVGREVVVALADPAGLAVFGADGAGALERRRDIALDGDPDALWAGDVDGDGRSELLVARSGDGKISVVEFESGDTRELAAGAGPGALAVGDVDGDEIVDIVAADYVREAVVVLRGEGKGEFAGAREFPADAPLAAIELADVDGDGALDVLGRGLTEPAVILCRNDGEGGLAAPVMLPFEDAAASGVGLVASPPGPSGTVAVSVPQGELVSSWHTQEGAAWLGHSEAWGGSNVLQWIGGGDVDGFLVGGESVFGRFTYERGIIPVEIWRGSEVRGDEGDVAVAVGELDGDGLPDVAAAGLGELHILAGQPDGSFAEVARLSLAHRARQLLVAEVTGDERPDVVVLDREGVTVVQGRPEGFAVRPVYTPAVDPRGAELVRPDPDGQALVAVMPVALGQQPEAIPRGLSLLRFDDGGVVNAETLLATEMGVFDVAAADPELDGTEELVVYATRDATPVLARLLPEGVGLVNGPVHDLAALSGVPVLGFLGGSIAVGDVDEDRSPDALVSNTADYLVITRLGDEVPIVEVRDPGGPVDELRDIDGDGHLDVVSVGWYGDLWFRPGRGDGTFEEEAQQHDPPEAVAGALAPAGVDAPFDMVTVTREHLASHRMAEVVRPLMKDDFGYFMGRTTDLMVRDLNHDGADDVVAISKDRGGGVGVLWGGSAETPGRFEGLEGPLETQGLALADLDGDGFDEVMTSSGISWVGAYRFAPEREQYRLYLEMGSLNIVNDIVGEDFDGDGNVDVAGLIRPFDGPPMRLAVTFGLDGDEYPDYTDWDLPLVLEDVEKATLEVGDVNGDGLLDVLVRPTSAHEASALLLARSGRGWSEAVRIVGRSAHLMARDGGGVELLVQDGAEVVRVAVEEEVLVRGAAVLTDESLAEAVVYGSADVDADGQMDLIVEGLTGTAIWLATGAGFERGLWVPASDMRRISVGDVDGDGRPDLVGRIDGRIAVRLARASAE